MPDHKKQLLTLGMSIGITSVIAIGWAVTFFPEASKKLSETNAEDIIGPFNRISEVFKEVPQEGQLTDIEDGEVAGTSTSEMVDFLAAIAASGTSTVSTSTATTTTVSSPKMQATSTGSTT